MGPRSVRFRPSLRWWLAGALLPLLVFGGRIPPAAAEESRSYEAAGSVRGRAGVTLSPLVFHEASFRARHEAAEREVDQASAVEQDRLGRVLEPSAEDADTAQAVRAFLEAAAEVDRRIRQRREVEGEYFPRFAEALPPLGAEAKAARIPALDPGTRTAVVAALRRRFDDAWTARDAAMDEYFDLVVRVEGEGWPLVASLTRGIQSVESVEPGAASLREADRLEGERERVLAAMEASERAIERLERERKDLEARTDLDPAARAARQQRLEEALRKERETLGAPPDRSPPPDDAPGLRAERARLEGKIGRLRTEAEQARRDRLAEGATGSGGALGLVSGWASLSSRSLELLAVRRRMLRATTEVEHLGALLTSTAEARIHRGIQARRRAVRDPDLLARLATERSAVPVEGILAAGDEIRDATLDAGLVSVVRRGLSAEDALLAQNEYLHGLATLLSKKTLRASDNWTWALQKSGNFLRGVLDLGFGTWDAFFDNVKQAVNRPLSFAGRHWRTKTYFTREKIGVERRKAREKAGVLGQMRAMTPEALVAFLDLPLPSAVSTAAAWVPVGQEGKVMDLLRQDRAFLDATNGGLRRLTAAYDATLAERLLSEYAIACDRAALRIDGLERAMARELGQNEDTHRWSPGILTSPGRMFQALFTAAFGRGSELRPHLALRRAQRERMVAVLPSWQDLRFDPGALAAADTDPGIGEVALAHADLLAHPDYARFWDVAAAEREAARQDLIALLEEEAAARGDWVDQREHAARREVLARVPPVPASLAGALVQDAADLAHQGDFSGAYAALARCNALDWRVVPTATLREVENALAGLESRETWYANLTQVADQAFYAALSAVLFPVGAASPSLGQGLKAALTTSAGLKGLATFAVQQLSPWASILNANTLLGGEIRVTLLTLGRVVTEGAARDALREGVFLSYLGPEWADVLANLIVDGVSWKAQRLLEARWLRQLAEEVQALQHHIRMRKRYQDILFNAAEDYQRALAGERLLGMASLAQLEGRIAELTRSVQFWRKAGLYQDEAKIRDAMARLGAASQTVADMRNPFVPRHVETVLSWLRAGLDSEDPDVRRRAEVEVFRRIDFAHAARHRNRLEAAIGRDGVRRLDDIRRSLVERATQEFLRAVQDPLTYLRRDQGMLDEASKLSWERLELLRRQVRALLYTGSSGNPDSREYKLIQSDIDITILVDGLDPVAREFLRKLANHCFQRTTTVDRFPGFQPDALDVTFMVDPVDLLAPTGWRASGPGEFPDQVRAALAADEREHGPGSSASFLRAMRERTQADLAGLRQNLKEPDKYVISGRLRALSYLAGISGVIWVPDPATGRFVRRDRATGTARQQADALARGAFEQARLEAWMGSDCMLDDLGFLHRMRKKIGNMDLRDEYALFDMVDKLDKYGIRVLLGGLAGFDEGRMALNALLTRPGGGDHGDICDIGIDLAGHPRLRLTTSELMVLREWRARKTDRRIHEMLRERMQGRPLPPPEDPVFHQALKDHVDATLSLARKLLEAGFETGCRDVMRLSEEAAVERRRGTPEGELLAQVFEDKRDRILLSYAAAYARLPEAEQAFVRSTLEAAGLDVTRFVDEVKQAQKAAKGDAPLDIRDYRFPWQYVQARERWEEERRRREGGR